MNSIVLILLAVHACYVMCKETPTGHLLTQLQQLKDMYETLASRLDEQEQFLQRKLSDEALHKVVSDVLQGSSHFQPRLGLYQEPDSRVVFHVQKTTTQPSGGTASFEHLVTQVGGVWNSVAHNFIVPMKGMYYFHLTVMSGTTGSVTVQVRTDTDPVIVAFANSLYDSGSAAILLEVSEFAQLSCYITRGTLFGQDSYGNFSHFSGFMLYPM